MVDSEMLSLRFTIDPGPGADAREVEEQTQALKREIQGLPVESVGLVSGGPAPAGTRSPEVLMAGTVAVTLLTPLLPKLIEVINGWLMRGKQRDVEITITRGGETVSVKVPATARRDDVLSFVDQLRARLGASGKDAEG